VNRKKRSEACPPPQLQDIGFHCNKVAGRLKSQKYSDLQAYCTEAA